MYIHPNSTIQILRQVPLDTTYDHTIYFSNATQQYTYFLAKTKYTFLDQTYQRVKRGYIRVQQNANNLYDCNYLMFQNTSYGNKWFYAFIKSVEYINDNVAEIEFEIDVMQTWMFDYSFDQCYVIREHSETDNIGDNLVQEDVNTGEYMTGADISPNIFNNWKIVIISTSQLLDASGNPLHITRATDGGYWGGIYGACEYHIFPLTAQALIDIKNILSALGWFNNGGNIVAFYMCPYDMIPSIATDWAQSLYDQQSKLDNFVFPCNAKGETSDPNVTLTPFGGYVPKNNKLYTYPYNYFICDNGQGDMKEFKYEYFPVISGATNIEFSFYADVSVNPSVVCYPIGYLQGSQPNAAGYEEQQQFGISIKNFPTCTWATNDLGAKLIQGGISLALLAATKGVSATYPGSVNVRKPIDVQPIPNYETPQLPSGGNLMVMPHKYTPPVSNGENGGTVSARLKPLDALIANQVCHSVINSHMTNHIGTSNTQFLSGFFDFTFKQMFLAPTFAEIVDNYFTRFGYACNKIKTPNISARPHWNYVKTSNCTITGSIPCDDMKTICDIYNNGITFWKNGNEIGNYSLDNSPIT